MTTQKVWFITGAARGMGIDIAREALSAGDRVVATARDADKVGEVLGEHPHLLALSLDITDAPAADAAAAAAVERFGRIDVLVNNAGVFYAGFFEELSPEQIRRQMEVNFFGPLNVTRAILPTMRAQRSGHLISISSIAGLVGQEFVTAYCASKFALEGWMESIRYDLEPFGISATIVEPGFFRTELLVEGFSTIWPELSVEDYADRTAETIKNWKAMNGKQGGDPVKLAAALVQLASSPEPPLRWIAGADAVDTATEKARLLLDQVDAHRALSTSLAHDDA